MEYDGWLFAWESDDDGMADDDQWNMIYHDNGMFGMVSFVNQLATKGPHIVYCILMEWLMMKYVIWVDLKYDHGIADGMMLNGMANDLS